MIKTIAICAVLALACPFAHAQQYGWVKVAHLGGLTSVDFVDSLHGWAGGASGAIYKTNDGGSNWTSFAVAFVPSSISMSDSLYGWAVGEQGAGNGRIYRTTNGGVSWFKQLSTDNQPYYGTAAQTEQKNTTAGRKINSPDTGKVVQTRNAGASWIEKSLPDSIIIYLGSKVLFIDSLHGWIAVGLNNHPGGIIHTIDGGISWGALVTPSSFQAFSFADTLDGWAGNSSNATIFRTFDGGKTWQFQSFVQDTVWGTLLVNAVSFRDSLNGWAFGGIFYQGIATEGIFRTTDGGRHWLRESIGLTPDLGIAEDGQMLDRYHGWAVCGDGSVLRYQIITDVKRLPELPKSFSLYQNYPNPFNPVTSIEYELIHREYVTLTVYDAIGRRIKTVVNQLQEPGKYRLRFDGSGLSSGVYHYTLKAGEFSETKVMMLVK